MKKTFLTFLGIVMLNSAFANTCKVSGDSGTVTVTCHCTQWDACARAQKIYDQL